MVPTLADGTPLCELAEPADRPHAYVKLWKHHAAQPQADRINAPGRGARRVLAAALRRADLQRVGVRQGAAAARGGPARSTPRMERWVEAADWIVWQLCGTYVRNACTAGYKGILPGRRATRPRSSSAALHPDFADFVDDKLEQPIGQLGDRGRRAHRRGRGLDRAARGHRGRGRQRRRPRHRPGRPGRRPGSDGRDHGHLDLPRDELRRAAPRCRACAASSTAASSRAAGATRPARAASATSSAGSSTPASRRRTPTRPSAAAQSLHEHLTELAADQAVGEHGLVALDWHSGNRSVLVDHELSGVVVGQTLATRPEDIYRALLEATAFGTRMIVEAFETSGVPVDGARRRRRPAQERAADADLRRRRCGCRCRRSAPTQGPALGSAIHAAVAAGALPRRRAPPPRAMGRVRARASTARPGPRRPLRRAVRASTSPLHDHFGRGNDGMHRLRAIRRSRPRTATGRHGRGCRGDVMTVLTDVRTDADAAAPRRLRPARRADPLRPGRLDGRQRLRPGAGPGPVGDQAQRRRLRRPDAGRHGRLRPGRRRRRGRPRPVVATPRRTPTSTAHMPEVGGVVHTHSTYATAWAARGEPIPCVLTTMADEFGGEIPVGPFALDRRRLDRPGHRRDAARQPLARGADAATTASSPIGRTARAAVKAAVMCEDVARTVHIARQLGAPVPIAPATVDRALRPLPERLRPALTTARPASDPTSARHLRLIASPADHRPRSGSSPGSQALYGQETLDQVADAVAARSPSALDGAPGLPVRVVWKPVLTDADAIQPAGAGRPTATDDCVGVIAWMHTFSPAKMWIAGLDAAAQAAAAPAHAGRRRRCRGRASTWTS